MAHAETAFPTGRVILTVGGDLGVSNGPGANEEDYNFFGYLDLEFKNSMSFDEAMLAALPQHEIRATLLDLGREIAYTGPRLSDVMRASGAEGKRAMPTAFDGYVAEIEWDMILQYEPILATHGDGEPLVVGKLGPLMVVFPVVEDKELYDSFEALQVWAMFFLGVE
ncbi:MAG: hypothetical protein QNJ09_11565 [Paracoccaceae bacterium]|nr:hypothetical protein [Paracoccaceae bacterium]